MAILPTLRDDNGIPLTGRGTETVTKRFVGVTTTGQVIAMPVDVKEVLIHIEGATEAARFIGTASGSEQVRITSDGLTISELPIVAEADRDIIAVAAASGTVNVSVIGWR
ncbi:MAG: hypothetical protein LDL33_11900 [Desulfomonile sp.]|nr:hypothetical protein [Desulfomonile sp.]